MSNGYKPIKNPEKIFEMKFNIIESADNTDLVLRNNKGEQTRFTIDTEIGKMSEKDQKITTDIAKFLGFKPSLIGTMFSKYKKAVEFLKDSEGEVFRGRSFETVYIQIDELIKTANILQR